ncbi:hypothetical protein JAAARDRAFT_406495 [Jaapia argillacea MUCL 33604]|uniref:Uncharacterized protein n=1 Tax=Jaapia argillacea MUCL 33604 TaxID=933084 RepID=A0A067PHV1_9AGAM|nr:hypothetical protein JAAARDRAFT_406495 [Jaapia argillacea MUCL 33604]
MHANACAHRIINSRIVLGASSPTCSMSAHSTLMTTHSLDYSDPEIGLGILPSDPEQLVI